MQQNVPPEFKWLADLATEVNESSGIYRNEQTPAEPAKKPEYWKYCPACGKPVFNTTDTCPSCDVSMGTHLDAVYAETIDRVSQATLVEERMQEDTKGKPKKSYKHHLIPFGPDPHESGDWFFGKPYSFTTQLPIEDCIKVLEQVTIDKRINYRSIQPSTSKRKYYTEIRHSGEKCYTIISPAQREIQELFVTSGAIWLTDKGNETQVIVQRSAPLIADLFYALPILIICLGIFFIPSIEIISGIIILWVIILIPVRFIIRRNKLLLHIRQWLHDTDLENSS